MGMSGVAIALKLQQAKVEPVALFEKSSELGGVWNYNTYPGAQCDIPSHLYSLKEHPADWSRMYAPQKEIQEYLRTVCKSSGILSKIRFSTTVEEARWNEAAQCWVLRAREASGRVYVVRARFLVSCLGMLSIPHTPDVPGLELFEGAAFHTAKWDHSVSLKGKRVAVVGTGSSAVQVIPALADEVASLTVFQRSAAWVMPKPDCEFAGLFRWMLRRVPGVQRAFRSYIFWSQEVCGLIFFDKNHWANKLATWSAESFLKGEIKDEALRAKLHPEFQFGCKEVLLSSTYLKTFTKPNVHLVTSGVKLATPTGIVDSDGVSRDFDAVVFATGFRPGDFVKQMPMIGRTGETLAEEWATKGWTAYLGMACSKFPNAFLMMGPNTALGHNSHVDMIEGQAAYITSFITQMRAAGLASGCLKEDVMEGFRHEIKQRLDRSVWSTGCHTWYFTNGAGGVSTIWPGFVSEYESRTRVAQLRDFDLVDKTGQPAKAPKAPVDWVRVQRWALLLSLVAALVALVVVFGS